MVLELAGVVTAAGPRRAGRLVKPHLYAGLPFQLRSTQLPFAVVLNFCPVRFIHILWSNATERQHAFTPDSAYAIFQAGVWFDHRLMGAEVSSGTVFELLKDDNLNKFSPNVVTRVGP